MPVTIETIPNEMLMAILDRCPLEQQTKARLVCRQWNIAVLRALARQKRLQLLVVNCDKNERSNLFASKVLERYYPTDGAKERVVRSTDIKDVYYLEKCFKNVSQLELHYVFQLDGMSTLLANWSLRLTSLTLKDFPLNVSKMKKTLIGINSLPLLRELRLLHCGNFVLPQPMPVLSRLESFTLLGYKSNIIPVLGQLGVRLERLSLDMVRCGPMDIYQVLALNPRFGENIQHFIFGEILVPKDGTANGFQNDLVGDNGNQKEVLVQASPDQYRDFLSALSSKMVSKLFNLEIRCASMLLLNDLVIKLIAFPRLTKLTLCYRSVEMDLSLATTIPLKSIRVVRLQFSRAASYEQFKETIFKVFSDARRIRIECEDHEFMDKLKNFDNAKMIFD